MDSLYNWMFFLHMAGLAAWFGTTLMAVLMLLSLKKKAAEASIAAVALSLVKNMNRITHLAAFLVLISGVVMIMDWNRDGMPFWLSFMERAGGMVILLFIIILSIFGAKLKKKLAGGDEATVVKSISTYSLLVLIFLVAILAVTFVVSLKL